MSSPALKKLVNNMLKVLSSDLRSQVEKHPGQLFVFINENFEATIRPVLIAQDYSAKDIEAILEEVRESYKKSLRNAQSRFLAKNPINLDRLNFMKGVVAKKHIRSSLDESYIILNMASANNAKLQAGKTFERLTAIDSKYVTGRVDTGDSALDAPGFQSGHGEYGYAVSSTKILAAGRLAKNASGDFSKLANASGLSSIIETYTKDLELISKIDLSRIIDKNGKLTENYVPILSAQAAGENQLDSKQEKAIIKSMIDSLKGWDYLNQEGSPTLKQDIEATLIDKFAKVKGAKLKSKTKPKTSVKRKSSSGKVTKKAKTKGSIEVTRGGGINAKATTKERPEASTALDFRYLIPIINLRLPDVVAKNMGSPKLNYRTGRFANSARVVDIATTPNGFPSIAYTYMRSPYEVFEYPTGSPRLATPDRDPRAIIQESIREIAVGLISQRFYTRRI